MLGGKNFELPYACSQLKSDKAMLFLFLLSFWKQVSFSWTISCHGFYIFCVFFWVILLFPVAPKGSAEMLSSLPKLKKAMMYLMENMCVR